MRFSSTAGRYASAGALFRAPVRSMLPRSSPQFEGVAARRATSTCSPGCPSGHSHLTSLEAAIWSRACGVLLLVVPFRQFL
jgi:hypothetical protein